VAAIHPQALHLEEEDFWILSQRQASEVLSEAEETRRTSVAAVGSHSSSLLTLLVQEVAARRTSAAAVGSQCYHHVRRRVHARHRVRHRVRCHSSSLLTLVPRSLAVAEETTQRAALAAALHSPSSAEPAVRSAAAGDFPSSLEEQRVAEDCSALL
jgi:DNA-binding transcriptional regulator LsrR (DeoR family)